MSAQFKQPVLLLGEEKRVERRPVSTRTLALLLYVTLVFLLAGGGYGLYHAQIGASSAGNLASSGNFVVYPEKPNTDPRFAANVTPTAVPTRAYTGNNTPPVSVPVPGQNELVVVNITQQQLTAYDNGNVVFTSLVTTGKITLQTPTGTFHVMNKLRNVMMYSKWPPGDPNYYAPEHASYAIQITDTGIYLHDATWRSVFGPGTEFPHTDPQSGQSDGSHGCVNMPLDAAQWLYYWILPGTTVQIVYQ